jgi:hypothetical protein
MLRCLFAVGALSIAAVSIPAEPSFAGKRLWCYDTPAKKICIFNFFSTVSGGTKDAPEPFLCRFVGGEASPAVLLASTRDDCTRAGGVVMADTADEKVSE